MSWRAADAKQRADHEESSRISVKWSPGTPESFATQQDGDMAVNTHETKSNEAESMAQQEQAVSLPPLPKKGSEGTSSAPASAFAKRNLQPLELEIGTMTSTSNGMIPGHSNRSLVWTPNTTTLVDRKSSLQISATRGLRLGEWRYQLTASNTELHHSSCHRLGSGNYGHVVLATNKATGEKIAVKILKSSDQSILNEVKSFVKAEGCPYLVQFFGGFILEGKVHIGLELMNLGSLEQLKHRVEEASLKIPAALLACITRQMVYGLNYLHEQCRLHRDIKPGNVLHNSKGQVKLTDFGISASRGTGLVGEVANQGTKKYMAPDESQSMDSDVWSLGLVICELAMMRYPYDTASTAWEVIIDVQPEPRLSEDHPAALREFVELTLKKLPGRATTEFLKGHAFLWTPRSDPMEFSSWLENLPGCSEKYAGWQVEPVHRKRSMRDLNSDGGVREEDVEPSLA